MKILHLYHDLMNLYGEYANISALTRMLEQNGIEVTVDRLSLKDEPSFLEYDLIYVGSGTERNQKEALSHLRPFAGELKEYVENDGFLLMTGNAFEMLGSRITDASGKVWEGLGLFPFTTREQNRVRNTADAVFGFEEGEKDLVGFINKCSTIEGIETPLFQVKMGLGNKDNDSGEGIRYRNCFGTHLTGPLLIKNPYFLCWLTRGLCGDRIGDLKTGHLVHEKAGYEITRMKLEERSRRS